MLNELMRVGQFMVDAFLHAWPYLLVTIPLAVAVNVSGISRYINKAFNAKPLVAILLATVVGAFSPFCSCGVIPVISALLLAGVPVAPVMSFWLASPSMDPEVFFLSVSQLGMSLAVWRLAGTFAMSLAGGYITHILVQIKWLDADVMKKGGTGGIKANLSGFINAMKMRILLRPVPVAASDQRASHSVKAESLSFESYASAPAVESSSCSAGSCGSSCGSSGSGEKQPGLIQKILKESRQAVLMIIKFMSLAFFLEALIILYIPEEWIVKLLGAGNRWAIPVSALVGVPLYTTNMSALGLMGGLLNQGMNPGAVLAFLISGATTTIPAMAAVYGLVKRRVFILYVGFTLCAALIAGYLYQFHLLLL